MENILRIQMPLEEPTRLVGSILRAMRNLTERLGFDNVTTQQFEDLQLKFRILNSEWTAEFSVLAATVAKKVKGLPPAGIYCERG